MVRAKCPSLTGTGPAVMSIVLGVFPDAGFHFYELAWRAAESIVAPATSSPMMLAGGEP